MLLWMGRKGRQGALDSSWTGDEVGEMLKLDTRGQEER